MSRKVEIQSKHNFDIDGHFNILNTNDKLSKKHTSQSEIKGNGWVLGFIVWVLSVGSFIVGIVGVTMLNDKEGDSSSYEYEMFTINTAGLIMTILGFVISALFLMFTVIRVCFTSTYQSLQSLRSSQSDSIQAYVDSIKNGEPELNVSCASYHMVSHTTTNSNGSTTTTTSRVTTHSETIPIPIESYQELTQPIIPERMLSGDFVKVGFYNEWMPSDEASQHMIKNVVDHLISKNEKRDTSFEISVKYNIKNAKFKEFILFALNNNGIPFLFHHCIYFLSAFIFMSFPFEVYFNSKVCVSSFTFLKSIKVSDQGTLLALQQNQQQVLNQNVQHIIHPEVPQYYIQPVQQYGYPPPQQQPIQYIYPPPQQQPQQYAYPPPPPHPQQYAYPPQQYAYPQQQPYYAQQIPPNSNEIPISKTSQDH